MDFGLATFGSGLSAGIGNLGIGIGNAINQSNISKENLKFQKDVFNYQKQLQREIFQREDTAVARRAKDILSQGGNPALAWETGQTSGPGNIVPTSAPQQQLTDFSQIGSSSLSQISGAFQQFMKYKLDDATIRSIDASIEKTNAEVITEAIRQKQMEMSIAVSEAERDRIRSDIERLNKKLETDTYNLEFSKNSHLRTTDNLSTSHNTIKDFINTVIPENIEDLSNISYKDVLQIALDVGLFALPGLASYKVASIGIKTLKSVLSFYRKNKGVHNIKDYITVYHKLTGRKPSKDDITNFYRGIKHQVKLYRPNDYVR